MKTYWKSWCLTLLLAVILALLFWSTWSGGWDHRAQTVARLSQIKQINATLNQDILKSRYGVLTDYDSIVEALEKLNELQDKLARGPTAIGGDGRTQIDDQLAVLAKTLAEQASLMEEFKFRNAILKNSVDYLPNAAAQIGGSADHDVHLIELIGTLLRDVLVYELAGKLERRVTIEAQIKALSDHEQYLSTNQLADLRLLLIHIQKILQHKEPVDALVDTLMALPVARQSDQLFRAYQSDFELKTKRANAYPLIFVFFSILLMFFMVNVLRELRVNSKALALTNEENQRLVAAIPSILIALDSESRITKWNPAAEAAFRASACAAVGAPLDALPIAWEGKPLTEYARDSVAARRRVSLDDYSFKPPEGGRKYFNLSITPVLGADGSPQGALLLGTDTTEHRALEIQLANAQKLESIGQLAAGIAHEINTPIQYVGDNVAFLKNAFADIQGLLAKQEHFLGRAKGGTLDEDAIGAFEQAVADADLKYLNDEVPRAIEQALDGVGRVAKIVRAMKEFSHPGSEGKVASDVNKLIDNTITVANNEWKYVADLVRDFDPSLPLVPCMAGEFNQVILNLIVNAAHAIGDRIKADPGRKGFITISTRAAQEGVEIRVKDTGTGIPEEARPKIFDPFFTTKPVGKGTGQGLTIAHAAIVKKHGGSLTFETEMGKGTTFIIRLPVAEDKVLAEHDVGSGKETVPVEYNATVSREAIGRKRT